MAIATTTIDDTFDQWRRNTNSNSINIGDIATLNAVFSATDLVTAINNIASGSGKLNILNIDSDGVYDSSPGANEGIWFQYDDTAHIGYIDTFLANTNTTLSFGTTNSADAIVTERLRIDNNGNFGIASSDIEAWGATYKALESIDSSLYYNSGAKSVGLVSNAYFDTTWKYKTGTDTPTLLNNSDSGFGLFTAPAGTIDTTITFLEKLRIDQTQIYFNSAQEDANFQVDYDLGRAFFIDGASGVAQFDNPLIMGANGTEGGEIVFDPGSSETAQTKTFDTASDSFRFHSNAVTLFGVNIDRSAIHYGGLVINEDGLDQDTRIEGSTLPSLFHVDAGNDNIGINNATPNISSIVDIVSTTEGILIPRMTTAQRDAISSPAQGLLIYDTDSDKFSQSNSTTWTDIATIDDVVALAIALG